jgi:putative transposase
MVKYRKALMKEKTEKIIIETTKGFKERYAIEVSHVGFDRNHVHFLLKFLPKYSGGQVIRLIKSITAREVFKEVPEIKKALWGGEFWTDGYYFATVSGRGDKKVIERYIEGQGRAYDINQLRLFEL